MCPEENHEDVQRAGAALLWTQAERAGGVQPGEQKAPERSWSTFQYLKGLQESWRGTFDKTMA